MRRCWVLHASVIGHRIKHSTITGDLGGGGCVVRAENSGTLVDVARHHGDCDGGPQGSCSLRDDGIV